MEETAEQAILEKLERKDTSSEMSCPGCGISLAIRLVIESLENFTMIGTSGCSGLLSKNMNLKVPFIYADSNPVAVARGIENAVVIAGDGSTAENLQSVIYAAQNDESMIYICLNNHGYSNANEHSEKHFAEIIANHARYVATASLAKPDDLIKKIQKASKSKGFKFIEILCPCPIFWGIGCMNPELRLRRRSPQASNW